MSFFIKKCVYALWIKLRTLMNIRLYNRMIGIKQFESGEGDQPSPCLYEVDSVSFLSCSLHGLFVRTIGIEKHTFLVDTTGFGHFWKRMFSYCTCYDRRTISEEEAH